MGYRADVDGEGSGSIPTWCAVYSLRHALWLLLGIGTGIGGRAPRIGQRNAAKVIRVDLGIWALFRGNLAGGTLRDERIPG